MRTALGFWSFLIGCGLLLTGFWAGMAAIFFSGFGTLGVTAFAELRSPAAHRAYPARRLPRVVAKVGRHDANPSRF